MSLLCPFFFFKTKTNAILVNSNNTFGMTSGRELFATQIRSKPCLSNKKKKKDLNPIPLYFNIIPIFKYI